MSKFFVFSSCPRLLLLCYADGQTIGLDKHHSSDWEYHCLFKLQKDCSGLVKKNSPCMLTMLSRPRWWMLGVINTGLEKRPKERKRQTAETGRRVLPGLSEIDQVYWHPECVSEHNLIVLDLWVWSKLVFFQEYLNVHSQCLGNDNWRNQKKLGFGDTIRETH